jgi:hypothetical protein
MSLSTDSCSEKEKKKEKEKEKTQSQNYIWVGDFYAVGSLGENML